MCNAEPHRYRLTTSAEESHLGYLNDGCFVPRSMARELRSSMVAACRRNRLRDFGAARSSRMTVALPAPFWRPSRPLDTFSVRVSKYRVHAPCLHCPRKFSSGGIHLHEKLQREAVLSGLCAGYVASTFGCGSRSFFPGPLRPPFLEIWAASAPASVRATSAPSI